MVRIEITLDVGKKDSYGLDFALPESDLKNDDKFPIIDQAFRKLNDIYPEGYKITKMIVYSEE